MDAGARSISPPRPRWRRCGRGWSRRPRGRGPRRRHVAADTPAGEAGQVVAVAGAKGGVGTTLLALLLARARGAGMSVCLVDLDLQTGDVAAFVGVQVRRNIVDLVEVADELSGRALGETTYDTGAACACCRARRRRARRGGRRPRRPADPVRAALPVTTSSSSTAAPSGRRRPRSPLEMADSVALVVTPTCSSLRPPGGSSRCGSGSQIRKPDEVDRRAQPGQPVEEVQPEPAKRVRAARWRPRAAGRLRRCSRSSTPGTRASCRTVRCDGPSSSSRPSSAPWRRPRRAPPPRTTARGRRARIRGEAGQATIETVAMVPLLLSPRRARAAARARQGVTFVFAGTPPTWVRARCAVEGAADRGRRGRRRAARRVGRRGRVRGRRRPPARRAAAGSSSTCPCWCPGSAAC